MAVEHALQLSLLLTLSGYIERVEEEHVKNKCKGRDNPIYVCMYMSISFCYVFASIMNNAHVNR